MTCRIILLQYTAVVMRKDCVPVLGCPVLFIHLGQTYEASEKNFMNLGLRFSVQYTSFLLLQDGVSSLKSLILPSQLLKAQLRLFRRQSLQNHTWTWTTHQTERSPTNTTHVTCSPHLHLHLVLLGFDPCVGRPQRTSLNPSTLHHNRRKYLQQCVSAYRTIWTTEKTETEKLYHGVKKKGPNLRPTFTLFCSFTIMTNFQTIFQIKTVYWHTAFKLQKSRDALKWKFLTVLLVFS